MPTEYPPHESTYVIDAENAAEMARLTLQGQLFTKGMGGLFFKQFDLSDVHDILDIACGPGGWVLDVAFENPEINVVGIDISRLMVEYARAQARTQGLDNAHFRVMDALKPLDFPENSFDFVNARFLGGFMPKAAWAQLLQECMRITRPGGLIRLTEWESPITNSAALEKLNAMGTRAMQLAERTFAPDGRHLGVTTVLGRFLRNTGCTNVQSMAHVIDFSAGTEAYSGMYQDIMVVSKLIQPFLIKLGVTTQEEIDKLYEQVLAEMLSEDFCGVWFYLSVWGEAPLKS